MHALSTLSLFVGTKRIHKPTSPQVPFTAPLTINVKKEEKESPFPYKRTNTENQIEKMKAKKELIGSHLLIIITTNKNI